MTRNDEREMALVEWIGRLGAASAEDVALHLGCTPAAARGRLRGCEGDGLIAAVRLLHGRPALFVATRDGLRASGLAELGCARVSAGGFAHHAACARVAVALERVVPAGVNVASERELRAWERAAGAPLASAEVGMTIDGAPALHRPDLLLLREGAGPLAKPVVVEVELTVKAPRRLRTIVRGWARSRLVAGVVYYAAPAASSAVRRAVAEESASERVHVLALARAGDLPRELASEIRCARSTNSVPSGA
jgi:hypothetical protein